jgi:hypothetical protein
MKLGPFHKHTNLDLVSRIVFLIAVLVVLLDVWLWRP